MITCNLCGSAFDETAHVRWRKDGYDIVECPSCRLLFRGSLPARDELDKIYAEKYFSRRGGDIGGQGYLDYVGEEEAHRLVARRRLDRLERIVRPGDLLDIGAAAGFFVDEAQRSGWTGRGVDVSAVMVAWGEEHLDVRLDLGDIHELELPPSGFDLVTMWDYIEHSRDPSKDLEKARRLLRPGGVLALSTGDASAAAARISGSRWHLLTPRHHNFFFTRYTIAELLRRRGFQVVSVGHPGSSYSLAYLAHKLRTLVDVRPVRAFAAQAERSSLGRISLPLNLFDIVTVVARARPANR